MMQLEDLVLNVLTVSATCSAVLLPLLLLAPRIQRRVAARSFHVLFLLLALRLLIPLRLTLPEPVVTVEAPSYTVTVPAPAPGPAAVSPAPQTGPGDFKPPAVGKTEQEIPLTAVVGVVWLAGIGVCLLWGGGSYALTRRRLLRGARTADGGELALMDALAAELGLRRRPKLVRAPNASGPLMLGLLRPVIVLPERPCAPQDLSLILRHELTHLRRGDVACKSVLSLACAVHWFNPLVWLMSRCAGRNLELCCDDAVVRGLSQAERRRYGSVLLDAAEGARAVALSTSFGSGKKQLKARLTNLFAEKKTSVVLVCLVLGAALLLGGLVACERREAAEDPANTARRTQYAAWFDENFQADCCSVVLTDLTGDGLDELIVLANYDGGDGEPRPMREGQNADTFYYMGLLVYGIVEDEVTQFYEGSIASSHAGWGYYYLFTGMDSSPCLLWFNPYNNQGFAEYSYELFRFDETGAQVMVDQDSAYFLLDSTSLMGDTGNNATREEVEDLLLTVESYRSAATPLLIYMTGYGGIPGDTDFRYWYADPEQVFAGKRMGEVVGKEVQFTYPLPDAPATPDAAIDLLEATLQEYLDGYAFRVPTYNEGEWDIQIYGRMRMEGDEYQSVHYLEGTDWKAGMVYSFETQGAYFSELGMDVSVTAPDGATAERTITLLEEDYAPGTQEGEADGVTSLTAAQLEAVNQWLEPWYVDENGIGQPTLISCFLTSYYDRPEDIDLDEFLAYCPLSENISGQAEFDAVKAHPAFAFYAETEADMPVPVHKYPAASVDADLKQYMGIGLADLSGAGAEELIYLEEYDAYYNFTSDFGPGFFVCVSGEIEGNAVRLHEEGGSVLTLRRDGDAYLIVSLQAS